ncbi:cysteine hydrolase family protein [Nitrosomonas sp.]|uniref:cysteine hydrolase family protein n=1 Tax=Nitrosomonas sp. TaxID=42353 RepID=UPI00208D9149|nr:isochorismatase family cysteine hydrolase [Nitrosomonas sp.]GJL75233.1 MAG: isochorismatase [Nitrosomonas sp.]
MKNTKALSILITILATCLNHSIALSDSDHKHNATTVTGYVYQQEFMPRQTLEIDLNKTAIFITDPQNDFISEGGAGWSLVGEGVVAGKVVERLVQLRNTARTVGIPVFYSTHMYTKKDYDNWTSLNGIDKIMFENKLFIQGTWGHDFHPDLKPDGNTIVLNPHKGLSNFWTGDAALQLRQYGVTTLIMTGMVANMCVESHARDAIENGFDLIIVADATAAAGADALKAAHINYEFLAHEVVTTDEIIKRLHKAKAEKN